MRAAWPEAEFREFAAYRARWPGVEARLDFWFSQVLALLANVFRGKGKAAVNAADLVPDWWGERADRKPQPKTAEDWRLALTAITRAMGGKIITPGKADGR